MRRAWKGEKKDTAPRKSFKRLHNTLEAIFTCRHPVKKETGSSLRLVIDNSVKITICFVLRFKPRLIHSEVRPIFHLPNPSRRFTQIIGRRASKPIKTRDTKFDYDNRPLYWKSYFGHAQCGVMWINQRNIALAFAYYWQLYRCIQCLENVASETSTATTCGWSRLGIAGNCIQSRR